MTPLLASILFIALAYLIGAVPFAYVLVRAIKGIDIRTVGSGNVGATNAARVLGLPYFFLIFFLDLAKGFLPTWFFPQAAAAWAGRAIPGLAVLVALAAILGHNFPIYLRFRGGKGVATSLGAVMALDAASSLAAFLTFLAILVVSRYVSLSSIGGGIAFAVYHFARTEHPWDRDQIAMSLLTIGLLGMLIVRHRQNLARIASGTEPKVPLRKKRTSPSGRILTWVVLGLVLLGGLGVALAALAARRAEVALGPFSLIEVARVGTGHQRAEHLTFANGGRLLAVACPRYQRLVLYRVTESESLELACDVPLEGRPMALQATRDRLFVLQRPHGDARHMEEAWWDTFDFQGRPIGSRFRVGFDPDDMAITADGRRAVVLLSGHAEGETNRPDPSLIVVDLGAANETPRLIGRLDFQQPGDDPDRLTLSATGQYAVVTLLGTSEVAAIDLLDPTQPRLIGRKPLPRLEVPYASAFEDDWILMPVDSERETVAVDLPGSPSAGIPPFLISTLPEGSALEVVHATGRRPLGRLPLRGPANLGTVRPTGLAYAPERSLLAVANRSGGIHLVAIRAEAEERFTTANREREQKNQ
ncbi:MAG: glycerol-3-phosphate 1-O-acyltransferase PlsY [Isosphaeraceae bacterium]|nr:glycerol-3-phosphate 1-O-acyltransferase PlsY [Isosphaeraceae bacterium]